MFFSVPIIVSILVPPNVVYIYSGIFYLPPLTPKFISNVLITGFFLSAFLLLHNNLIQVCKNDTFHILPKTDFGVIK